MSEQHARLSPSNHRWVSCPGSVREEHGYPDIAGEAAIDGTGTHLLLEMSLSYHKPPSEWLNKVIGAGHHDKQSGWLVTRDRVDRVEIALSYIERRKKELKDVFGNRVDCINVYPEMRSDPGDYFGRDDWWGTCDITLSVYLAYDTTPKYVEIIDYKDGRGFVDVKDNPQLIAYLGGRVGGIKETIDCRMTIIQPKTSPPIRYENTDSFEVQTELLRLLNAAKKTDEPDAPLIPDNKRGKGHCRWCKHAPNCTALKTAQTKGLHEMLNEDLKKLLSKPVVEMSEEELSEILNLQSYLKDILKEVETESETRLKNGGILPGYTLAPGNSKKEWAITEEELLKKLSAIGFKKNDAYTSKLISPAQVLNSKRLTDRQKERFFSQYINVIEGSLKLKKVTEKKAENPVDVFSDIDIQCKSNESEISFL